MQLRIFFTRLLNLSLRSPSYAVILVIIGILTSGLATNSIYDFLTTGNFSVTAQLITWLFIFVALGASYLIYAVNSKTAEIIVVLNEKSGVDPKPILVTGLSPYKQFDKGGSNLDVVINLIRKNKAEIVYLVSVLNQEPDSGEVYAHTMNQRDNQGVEKAYKELKHEFPDKIEFRCLSLSNTDSSQQSYKAVAQTLAELQSENSLSRVAVDVTAGTKAMSVGMSAAAIQFGVPLTYLATPRDKQGEPDHSGVASVITTLYSDDLKRAILASSTDEQ
jgi:hypothetical protein